MDISDSATPIARIGRTFIVAGSPEETWGNAFDDLLSEFHEAGHDTLRVRRVVKVSAMQRGADVMTTSSTHGAHCQERSEQGTSPLVAESLVVVVGS